MPPIDGTNSMPDGMMVARTWASWPAPEGIRSDLPPANSALTASKKGQSELDRSIDSKTVPSRYKSQIPKEYHGYIPWGR